MVRLLVAKAGKAEDGGVRFYSFDNEPALWPTTHPRIHPGRTTYAEMAARTEATAAAITAVDPGAQLLGGVMFGWSEYLSLNEAPDAHAENAKLGTNSATYLDFLLSQMKRMEGAHKRRLVHGLDVHWYPEARGRKRITDSDDLEQDGRGAPASAAQPVGFDLSREELDCGDLGKAHPAHSLAARTHRRGYPGTKLAITEYDFGAGNHISGGLAQADALGVFGREGVDLATTGASGAAVGPLPPYVKAAFRLYRNYDGKGGAFGDTAVEATVADPTQASVFAATDSKHPRRLTIVVINKNQYAFLRRNDFHRRSAARSSCRSARVFVMQAPGRGHRARFLPSRSWTARSTTSSLLCPRRCSPVATSAERSSRDRELTPGPYLRRRSRTCAGGSPAR